MDNRRKVTRVVRELGGRFDFPFSIRTFWVWALLLMGCAGTARSCASCNAENFGADWVVVQVDLNGNPFRCWALTNTSIANEARSDGIYWESSKGNLVHLSGLYNRVQVIGGHWDDAYAELGLTEASCRAIAAHTSSVPSAPASNLRDQ